MGAATTLGLAGCTGDSVDTTTEDGSMNTETATPTETVTPTETEAAEGRLRVAHMSPNAPNVDVYLEDTAVLEDVEYGAVSGYLSVAAGEHTVTITAAGDPGTEVFSGPVTVAAGTDYTVAATGELGEDVDRPFEPLVFEDDTSEVADDEARLQVVHASPDAPAVDVTAGGGDITLFDGVAFGEFGSVTIDAGEYTVQIRGDTEGNDGDVVAEFDIDLAGGEIYTAFAAGYLMPSEAPANVPFNLLVTTSSGREAAMVPEPEPEEGRVKVAHFSPNAPDVDVYVDGSAVLEDVSFGVISDYMAVPAGSRAIEITPADDPNTAVFSGDVPVTAGTDYTIAAAGEVGDMADRDFEPLILEDDTTTPESDMAKVRLVHASPDAPAVDVTLANGDVLFDGVTYGESGYITVPAGGYTLEVRGDTEGNDGDVVASFDLDLEGGTVYSGFAIGYLTPDDEPGDPSFDLALAVDASPSMN